MEQDDFDIENWIAYRDKLKRQFTIQCKDQCELLTLSIHDLNIMKNEFREAYTTVFENSFTNLRRTIQVKLKAIRYSNKYMTRGSNANGMSFRYAGTIMNDHNMNEFEPIDQADMEDASSDFDTDSHESFLSKSSSSSENETI
jgi:hypothetical protein